MILDISDINETSLIANNIKNIRLTKEFILQHTTQESIMEYYTGIPITKKGNFKSPLRSDRNPTCAYFKNSKGELILKDFNGDFYGSCFDVVKRIYNVNYYQALKIIANDFNIQTFENIVKNKCKISKLSNTILEETKSSEIDVKIRDFTDGELKWWNQFGISKTTLNKFKVFSCDAVYLNGDLYSYPTTKSFNFCYYHPSKDKSKKLWKIYYPQNRKNRFIGNYTDKTLQGSHILPKSAKYCIITKSLKDVMVLYELNIPSIAPNSESILISDNQFRILNKRYNNNVYMFYDFDLAGIKTAKKFKSLYPNHKCIFLQRKWSKDISDLCKMHGLNTLLDAGGELIDILEGKINLKKTKYFYIF